MGGWLGFAAVLLVLVGYYWSTRQRASAPGVLTLANGHKYVYSVGDNLPAEFGRFHGMDIELPRALSDFYLDAQQDSPLRGPGVLFADNQIIGLEGDFQKYFRLYVPLGTQVAALSILSPDVMHTLISKTAKFDVQLHENHLRIITPRPSHQQYGYDYYLKLAAEALLPEIDQRLSTWQPGAVSTELQYKKGMTFKIGQRTIRRRQLALAIVVPILVILLVGFGLAGYYTLQDHSFTDPYSKGWLAGTFMFAALYILTALLTVVPLFVIGWFLLNRQRILEYVYGLFGISR